MNNAYCYGMISPSTLYTLRSDFPFPQPNTYAEIANSFPSVGGEAANSAIILAKLGLRTKLDGNWLNRVHASKVTGLLGAFDVDLSRLSVVDAGGTDEIVISDQSSRTVFGNYASFHAGARQWNEPQAQDIENADIVCLDPYFRRESELAAELCEKYGKRYVTLDSPYEGYLAQHAAAIVISHELRDSSYLNRDVNELFAEYQRACGGLVIFTFGSDALWYGRQGEERKSFTPFQIEPVDTTGAGDSFRAAIAYGVLRGWTDDATVEFASAVAACVCLSAPHTLNAPGKTGILQFLDQQRALRQT